MTGAWWRDIPSWVNCYHPYPYRELVCAKLERCGYCGAIRLAPETKTYWPPVTKNWADTPLAGHL